MQLFSCRPTNVAVFSTRGGCSASKNIFVCNTSCSRGYPKLRNIGTRTAQAHFQLTPISGRFPGDLRCLQRCNNGIKSIFLFCLAYDTCEGGLASFLGLPKCAAASNGHSYSIRLVLGDLCRAATTAVVSTPKLCIQIRDSKIMHPYCYDGVSADFGHYRSVRMARKLLRASCKG